MGRGCDAGFQPEGINDCPMLERNDHMKNWKPYILVCLWAPLLIAQLLLVLVLGKVDPRGLGVLKYAGYAAWLVSCVLGWLPILVLGRKGGVPKGKSYVHTTALVETGIYSIVRHPQYTAGLMLNLALILISQTWLVALLGFAAMVILYADIVMTDHQEIAKFGTAYRNYMKRVPRTNFAWGVLKRLFRRPETEKIADIKK